jgi:hypothetical protein
MIPTLRTPARSSRGLSTPKFLIVARPAFLRNIGHGLGGTQIGSYWVVALTVIVQPVLLQLFSRCIHLRRRVRKWAEFRRTTSSADGLRKHNRKDVNSRTRSHWCGQAFGNQLVECNVRIYGGTAIETSRATYRDFCVRHDTSRSWAPATQSCRTIYQKPL